MELSIRQLHFYFRQLIYAQNAVRKIHTYEKNGIYPGERLILTFETKKSILDTRMIDALVYRYL